MSDLFEAVEAYLAALESWQREVAYNRDDKRYGEHEDTKKARLRRDEALDRLKQAHAAEESRRFRETVRP